MQVSPPPPPSRGELQLIFKSAALEHIADAVGRVRTRRAPRSSSGGSGVAPYRGGNVPYGGGGAGGAVPRRRDSGSAVSVASAAGASSVFSGGAFSHVATASAAAAAPAPVALSLGAQALADAKQLLSEKVITFAQYLQLVSLATALDAEARGGAAAPGAPPAVGGDSC